MYTPVQIPILLYKNRDQVGLNSMSVLEICGVYDKIAFHYENTPMQ